MKCPCGKANIQPGTRCPACQGLILTGDMLHRAMKLVQSVHPGGTEPIADIIERVCAKYGVSTRRK